MNRFVILAQRDRFTVTELCEQFGISRKTGYKHLERYAEEGLKGLQARSHRPHQFPQRTDEIVEALILAERRLHRPSIHQAHRRLTIRRLSSSNSFLHYTSDVSAAPKPLDLTFLAAPANGRPDVKTCSRSPSG